MNLENLNLVELNAQEAEEVDGGLFFIILGAVATIALGGIVADWDDFKKGVSGN